MKILPLLFLLLLTSCKLSVSEDGCLLGEYTYQGQTYQAGPCVSQTPDPANPSAITRYRFQWQNAEGYNLRATYTLNTKIYSIEYKTSDDIWVGWSSKSGILLGPVPPEVKQLTTAS